MGSLLESCFACLFNLELSIALLFAQEVSPPSWTGLEHSLIHYELVHPQLGQLMYSLETENGNVVPTQKCGWAEEKYEVPHTLDSEEHEMT